MRTLTMALLAFGWAPASHAVHGDYLPANEFPPGVCRIQFYRGQNSAHPEQTCTGTIIDRRRLLTAAHCEVNLEQIDMHTEIACGRYVNNTPVFIPLYDYSKHVHHPDFQDKKGKTSHDVAIIEVGEDLSGPPIRLARSKGEVDALLAHSARCAIFGYGQDNYAVAGMPHGAAFRYQPGADFDQKAYQLLSVPNAAAPGDSGGPVLCPDESGQWVEIATHSSMEKKTGAISFHERSDNNLPWIEAVLRSSKLPKSKHRHGPCPVAETTVLTPELEAFVERVRTASSKAGQR